MQVALITDRIWLDEELGQFKHLIVGMLDENVRVVQVVPQGLDDEYLSAFGKKLRFKDISWPQARRWFLRQLACKLEVENVDVLHVLDSRSWRGAVDLANKMQLPIVLNLANGSDLDRAAKLHKLMDPQRIAWLAATEPLARGLRDELGTDAFIQTVRMGVHLPEIPYFKANEGPHTPCLVVTGNGTFDQAYDKLLLGLADVIAEHRQLQVFLDGRGKDQHKLWRAARKRGLLSNISFVPHRVGHRDLMLHADMLLQPQARGDARSLTLQAMAQGIPIVAQIDPWLDYLVDAQTARLLDEPNADRWSSVLCELLADQEQMAYLSRRGREWIDEYHIPAKQVQQILGVYRKLAGESIPFPELGS